MSSDSNPQFSKVSQECISEHDDGQRLDNYLIKRLKGVPKSRIYQIIRKGEVRLDKKRAKPDSRIRQGQILRIPPIRLEQGVQREQSELRLGKHQSQLEALQNAILYEDEYLLVLNKPAGLAVHGGSGVSLGMIELLRAARPAQDFLELVHRLDRDTSGAIVVAKKGKALRELHQLIRDNQLGKYYLALLDGRWKGARHVIEAPLQKNHLQSGERVVRVSREGKASCSVFTVMERFSDSTLVEVELRTGRTHQIRVHSQYAGYPIIGDPKYGHPQANESMHKQGFERMFLHALRLHLPLSFYEKPLLIEAPLDKNWQACLALKRNQPSS